MPSLLKSKPWAPGMAEPPTIDFVGSHVRIRNLRNFRYECGGSHVERRFETRTYDLAKIQTVDFITVPFKISSDLAHTMMSFGFTNGQHVCVSIEARRRIGQKYSIVRAAFNTYPLFYVIADERDAIGERVECRRNDVYLYRCTATPGLTRSLFLNILEYANQLAIRPQAYNLLWRNCTTGIRNHVNRVWPGHIPWSWRILFTGHVDHMAYRMGLFHGAKTFAETKKRAYISEIARGGWHREDYSLRIRQQLFND